MPLSVFRSLLSLSRPVCPCLPSQRCWRAASSECVESAESVETTSPSLQHTLLRYSRVARCRVGPISLPPSGIHFLVARRLATTPRRQATIQPLTCSMATHGYINARMALDTPSVTAPSHRCRRTSSHRSFPLLSVPLVATKSAPAVQARADTNLAPLKMWSLVQCLQDKTTSAMATDRVAMHTTQAAEEHWSTGPMQKWPAPVAEITHMHARHQ
jgi:hypothetical protein